MDQIISYPEGNNVVNERFIPIGLKRVGFIPESKSKPTIVITPEGTDNLTIEKSYLVISPTGALAKVTKQQAVRFERQIELFGEMYSISESQDGIISIFSRTWPLSGSGEGIDEALSDLRETIHDLKDHYAHTPIDQLDGRAILFRDFVLSVNA